MINRLIVDKPSHMLVIGALLVVLLSGTVIWYAIQDNDAKMIAMDPFLQADKLDFIADFWLGQSYAVTALEKIIDQRLYRLKVTPTNPDMVFADQFELLYIEIAEQGFRVDNADIAESSQAKLTVIAEGFTYGVEIQQLNALDHVSGSQIEGSDVPDLGLQTAPEIVKPKLALVIDDWGYNSSAVDSFLQYPLPLTVAVLPYLAISQEVAERAAESGFEVILHQPMEALNSFMDIGKGGITSEMSSAEIEEQLHNNLAYLPMISGLNNHMGSKITADVKVMQEIMHVVKERGLYFLDSTTTPLSVIGQVAKEVGVPYAVNNLFIDNINEVEAIKTQLRLAMSMAKKNGSAIAIGHVRPDTAQALWDMIPEFAEGDIKLVVVSQVLNYPEPAEFAFEGVHEEGLI